VSFISEVNYVLNCHYFICHQVIDNPKHIERNAAKVNSVVLCQFSFIDNQHIQIPDPFAFIPYHIFPQLYLDLTRNLINAEPHDHLDSLHNPATLIKIRLIHL
jgi:hypothetical protein